MKALVLRSVGQLELADGLDLSQDPASCWSTPRRR